MKVVTPKEMQRIEALAYAEGCSERSFMQAAGEGIASCTHQAIQESFPDVKEIILLCGQGNNAGDAYVAGRYLLSRGYIVKAIQAKDINVCSPLCRENHNMFVEAGGEVVAYDLKHPVVYPEKGIILDGIFGTGFYGLAREPYASLIRSANSSKLPIFAIDVPSGLDGETGAAAGPVIVANATIALGLPKLGYFLAEGWNHVGTLWHVDFGLPEKFIEQAESAFWLPSSEQLSSLLPPIVRDRHKYEAGVVVGLGGSPGMPGAAILAVKAAMHSGAGIVRLLHPDGMAVELAALPPEIIRLPYNIQNVGGVVDAMNMATAVFLGPGMGRSPMAQVLLELVLPQLKVPCVVDADALYLLAQSDIHLPGRTILTPHRGEMSRLLQMDGRAPLTLSFLQQCQEYVEKHQVTLVLKGGPGFIFHPNLPTFINVHGDPGMATGGSGDVLTGLLTALLAQGLSPHAAALLGVFLHARAGEIAADSVTSYCLIASTLIQHFPAAFRSALPKRLTPL